jgi:2-hydroxychromene-2-carboxylate isomerase
VGELIPLVRRPPQEDLRPDRAGRARLFFDLSCPLSYLAIVRAERTLGRCAWVPVPGLGRSAGGREVRDQAERLAEGLRLPLVWPERWPAPALSAARAAAYAAERRAGGPFAAAAARLAFAGGFDLEEPAVLADAAASAGLDPEAVIGAAEDLGRDEALLLTAATLREARVPRLPAVRIGRRWLTGEAAVGRLASGHPRC